MKQALRWSLVCLVIAVGLTAQSVPLQAGSSGTNASPFVVLISIDGLRPDAIEAADATVIKGLIARGAWCAEAQTIRPSLTLPSHTSMLTGLDFQHHGVDWNSSQGGHVQHPTVLSLATDAGLSTAAFIGKDKLAYLCVPKKVDLLAGAGAGQPAWIGSETVANLFASHWPKKQYRLAFVHLADPDAAGHGHGWMSPQYLEAVRAADRAVGRIIKTLEQAHVLEQTILIVTADHGGKGTGHSEPIPEDETIPWICAGPGVKAGMKIDRVVRIFDTAPTILQFLGVPIPEGLALDGKPVLEVMPASPRLEMEMQR